MRLRAGEPRRGSLPNCCYGKEQEQLMKTVDHYWRLFSTTLSFTVFGLAGLVMGLILFPLMFVFVSDRSVRKKLARKLIGGAFGLFFRMMRLLGVMRYEITGLDELERSDNLLIVANHPTLIDVVVLLSLFPQANCVIKEAVTRNIFMRSVVAAADYISNSEPEELLNSCVAYLQSGGSLMLFPEGTRTVSGAAMEFKPGAATVAARSGVDILPIAIQCEPIFLTKELPWHFVPETRPAFTIHIMPVVSVAELVAVDDVERHMRQELNIALRNLIQRELDAISEHAEAGEQLHGV